MKNVEVLDLYHPVAELGWWYVLGVFRASPHAFLLEYVKKHNDEGASIALLEQCKPATDYSISSAVAEINQKLRKLGLSHRLIKKRYFTFPKRSPSPGYLRFLEKRAEDLI